MPGRQGMEGIRVHQHQPGLMEHPHLVFAAPQVHGGLAPDGRIHLGQGGGGAVDKIDAPHIAPGGEPRQIPDHPAAQGQYPVLAGKSQRQHSGEQGLKGGQAFASLPLGQGDQMALGALGQGRLHQGLGHPGIRDHQDVPL